MSKVTHEYDESCPFCQRSDAELLKERALKMKDSLRAVPSGKIDGSDRIVMEPVDDNLNQRIPSWVQIEDQPEQHRRLLTALSKIQTERSEKLRQRGILRQGQ